MVQLEVNKHVATQTFENYAFTLRGNFLVGVHNDANPSPEAWAAYIDLLKTAPDPQQLVGLIITHGGSPTTSQRQAFTDALESMGTSSIPYAIMLKGVLPRMALRSVSFFNKSMRGFGLDDLDGALDFLGRSQAERSQVLIDIRAMCQAVRIPMPG